MLIPWSVRASGAPTNGVAATKSPTLSVGDSDPDTKLILPWFLTGTINARQFARIAERLAADHETCLVSALLADGEQASFELLPFDIITV